MQNQCLGYDPNFQGVNRMFLLSFEDNAVRTAATRIFVPVVEVKDYNFMIDGRNVFVQLAKIYIRKCDNRRKINSGQGGNYSLSPRLPFSQNYYKIMAIDLSKQ